MPRKRPGDAGLYDAIHAKRRRIAGGSGERMREPGSKGAPTDEAFRESAKTARRNYRNGGCVMAGRGPKYKGSM